jgi:hypothetical protein
VLEDEAIFLTRVNCLERFVPCESFNRLQIKKIERDSVARSDMAMCLQYQQE